MAKCTAKSKRTGLQCGHGAIPGGTVCKHHGGSAPQVKAKAAERLAALVDPAIDQLTKLLKDKISGVQLAAVRDVLDRAGHKAPEKHELSGPDGGAIPVEIRIRFPEPKASA